MAEENFLTLTHISPELSNANLTRALSDWFKKEMEFTHWEYVGDTAKGDSYLSELIRIKIHGKDKNGETCFVQVVLKSIPKSVSRRLTFRSDEFFRNEINFYNYVLPALLEFQATKKMTEPFDNYAKVFMSHTDGENDFICLEDASVYSFGCAVRQVGIDVVHCKHILKTFAKFHAMSFAMRDQCPEKFWEIKWKIFETYYHERLWGWYRKFWNCISSVAIDAVEKEYPNTKYVEKIKEFSVPETLFKIVYAVNKTFDTGVISHGDSWTNNFIFKYENGTPLDAKMIDFQLTRCASPVLDLSFFVYACTDQELRLKHYDELLDYYYTVLSKQISEMDSDPEKVYPRSMFWDEIKKYSYFGLAFSFESTPFIVLDPEDAFDMEMKSIILWEKYRKRMRPGCTQANLDVKKIDENGHAAAQSDHT
ncbi:hypothetical protein EVAR_90044_1 [Eumeta japonica]|uniref:CHK kinase-like domain-containing protein n=1 Tax=Eumeta variegata TaxID=151549 RepID=A0A4C1WV60_EUMVA|nr:hypothetical protein EVAR_90044_1 [Eumeta japonica]